MGTIYDGNGGRYEVNGNYLLPCLTIGSTGKNKIGMWGQRHKRYLKSHHRVLYYNLLTAGKLNNHLIDVDQRAQTLFERWSDINTKPQYAESMCILFAA